MKIVNVIKWIFLCTFCTISAQNNFSAEVTINAQPTKNIKINQVDFGIDYGKTYHSKYRIENELKFDSKDIIYPNNTLSNAVTTFTEISNKFIFSYFKNDKIHFNFKVEPYAASENNLKIVDIDLLGELNVDFILSSNKKLTVGASRNNFLGKTMILPVFSYYYQYGPKVNISIGFPESKWSYSNNSRNVFAVKSSFNGSSYNLDNDSKPLALNSTKSSFSQWTTGLDYERNMDSNWYVIFKMGYDFNRKYLLLDSDNKTTLNFNLKEGCQFGLTIKYKQ